MLATREIHERWTVKDAAELYGILNWGGGYFNVNARGEVTVNPSGRKDGPTTSLHEIVKGLRERGMEMPVLLRFEGILASRLAKLNQSFKQAIADYGYRNEYRGVFPIKVNQQQQVIEEITSFGRRFHHGLEAGSKAELLAAMAYLDDPEALLICNGYKDSEFIDLGLYGRMLGLKVVFVIETMTEVPLLIERSKALDVAPIIGVRIKLSSSAGGHWKDSGGDRSVFGLNTAQLIQVADQLKAAGMIDCLQLLHYHLGSQIPNIRDIRSSVVEATRVYAGLVKEGAPMGMLDLGGGLAVDYDGSATNFASSCNYSIDEYCRDLIEQVMTVLDEEKIPHPLLVTESGRATVAYYSVLIFNILDVSSFSSRAELPELPEDAHDYTRNIHEAAQYLTLKNLQETYHDAIYYRDEVRELFKYGKISIRERGLVEDIFWHVMHQIMRKKSQLKYVPDDLEGIEAALADIYYGNLSVFQSLPDIWAIDQLFPVMPIHRLGERPQRTGVIADITCDCDGKIDRFIDLQDVKQTLPLHDFDPQSDGDYCLGVFLTGAYQETLGDLHNLLGDPNVVSLRVGEDGDFEFVREIEGDSVEDVLEIVEYNPKVMIDRFRAKAERAIAQGLIPRANRRDIMDVFQQGMKGFTYYER